jgi:hypothetical protein
MADWIDHLTRAEAQKIVTLMADPKAIKTRFEARDDRGQKATRYSAPTKAELDRVKAKANDGA